MSRPTKAFIDQTALLHNVRMLKAKAKNSKLVAMVKADAYGCGLAIVAKALQNEVDAFGFACCEEAQVLRKLGIATAAVVFQGAFAQEDYFQALALDLQLVVHSQEQLKWLLDSALPKPVKIWLKINTGMNRLGFDAAQVPLVLEKLSACPWVADELCLLSHFASADEPELLIAASQLRKFQDLINSLNSRRSTLGSKRYFKFSASMANSAALYAIPESQLDWVRPGIMLYGISPFANSSGQELGLKPVMHFYSAVSALRDCLPGDQIGYGGTWTATSKTKIAVVTAGYGDGYPRVVAPATQVFLAGHVAPIIGRISMDSLTIDLSAHPALKKIQVGTPVELWGENVPVEQVAIAANTISYELLCRYASRAPHN